ncbi:MAG: hypothetical protein SynsKO_23420 [Synoicihabitans sp.]
MSTSRAVFISYASEDSAAAAKLADSLRQVGLEVWLDQSELKGGDAWDEDIKRQIRECTLFVPLISAQSNRRLEGYFRLEWKLAAERTHSMAAGVRFIFPVLLDGLREPDAVVPPDFKSFQWSPWDTAEAPTRLVTRMEEVLTAPTKLSDSSPSSVPFPAERGKGRAILGWGVAIVALGAALFLLSGGNQFPSFDQRAESNEIAPARSIAVLPFNNLSPEAANAYIASGVHEDVMVHLSRIDDLQVTAKTVVARYGSEPDDFTSIGAELGVQFILKGSVRKAADKVRVTVQLVDVSANQTVWAEEFERGLDNIFALQSEIAREVATSLRARIDPELAAVLDSPPTESPLAYDAYLNARSQLGDGFWIPFQLLDSAEERLNLALELDPDFAEAWALLAVVNSRRVFQLWSIHEDNPARDEAAAIAANAVERARALAPDGLATLEAEGIFFNFVQQDFIAAIRAVDRALRLVPNDSTSLMTLGHGYRLTGQVDLALASFERALALDPSDAASFQMLLLTHRDAGNYTQLIDLYLQASEAQPDRGDYVVELKYYQFLVDGSLASFEAYEVALNSVQRSDNCNPAVWRQGRMTVAMLRQDFETYAEHWHQEWEAHHWGHGEWVCPLQTNEEANHAAMLLGMGENDAARDILNKAALQVEMPINPMAQCAFNPAVIKPKLHFLTGEREVARKDLQNALDQLEQKDPYYRKFVEKGVLLEAAEMVAPDLSYQIYRDIQDDPMRQVTFESVCANPWTYPNLIQDSQFQKEIRADGRFVEFLEAFNFI